MQNWDGHNDILYIYDLSGGSQVTGVLALPDFGQMSRVTKPRDESVECMDALKCSKSLHDDLGGTHLTTYNDACCVCEAGYAPADAFGRPERPAILGTRTEGKRDG